MSSFSSTWLKKSGYSYPPVDQMLRADWIKSSSPQMSPNINDPKGTPYYVYGHLSNYVHGNVLNKEHHGNERFWVISETLVLSGRIAELVSIKILGGSQRKVISEWIKRISKNYPKFKDVWTSRSQKLYKTNFPA